MCSKTHPGPKNTPKRPQGGRYWRQCTSCGPINWFWAKKTNLNRSVLRCVPLTRNQPALIPGCSSRQVGFCLCFHDFLIHMDKWPPCFNACVWSCWLGGSRCQRLGCQPSSPPHSPSNFYNTGYNSLL